MPRHPVLKRQRNQAHHNDHYHKIIICGADLIIATGFLYIKRNVTILITYLIHHPKRQCRKGLHS